MRCCETMHVSLLLQLRRNNEGAILKMLTFYSCIRIKCDHKKQLSRIIDVVMLNFNTIVIITIHKEDYSRNTLDKIWISPSPRNLYMYNKPN